MNVLLLEDDEELTTFIVRALRELGHGVHAVSNGEHALSSILEGQYDVAILDRLVPGLDGVSVVKSARRSGAQIPILMLTALGGIEDRVVGLEAGADDYLVKPFAFAELAARLNALARRPAHTTEHEVLTAGDIQMDLRRRTVRRAGHLVELQPREFSLLEQLMRSPDRVVTRTLLLERIWNFGFDPQTNIVETHMSRLRSKLSAGFGSNPIRTVRGAGYILKDADDG